MIQIPVRTGMGNKNYIYIHRYRFIVTNQLASAVPNCFRSNTPMGTLNPANTNPNPLVYDPESFLASLQNLSLNENNSLGSNAAPWMFSRTRASSSNNLTGNNLTYPGSVYGGLVSSSAWNFRNQSFRRRSQDGSSNMVVGSDRNSLLYMAGNQIIENYPLPPRADHEPMGMMSLNSSLQSDSPWNLYATQPADFSSLFTTTRPRNNSILETATTWEGSHFLQGILKEGDHDLRQQILDAIIGDGIIFEVMDNEYGHHLFQRLLDVCDPTQLKAIFSALASTEDLFIDVALHRHGSTAVQALIKKLKKSDFGFTITSILSRRFLELMTSKHGRYVVQQCFNTFKPRENEVLYDAMVRYFKELATSEHGCASLNDCLSCIGGEHRAKLLTQISEHSDFLSNDPWGHFVVQEVLELKDENFTRIICNRLEGLYIQLARKKGGSHVVEKCIKSSEFGMRSVVGALLKTKKQLLPLATDQFGNYVVQTALRVTKQHDVELYGSLLELLKKRNAYLSRNVNGKHIVNLIKELENQ
ncbi:PREDICTED: putative pumilio homolog 19 isoform X2 [Ipomoea nil]|uniref:putative pumilio homolog 19 isoform X2 n=1 Tax=Ipomoea nil TaxID=35883 RepID=UPI000900C371|nr:PREDICTED: putative pumilio homolog 19 isoform X2 [Ipomoea nil]